MCGALSKGQRTRHTFKIPFFDKKNADIGVSFIGSAQGGLINFLYFNYCKLLAKFVTYKTRRKIEFLGHVDDPSYYFANSLAVVVRKVWSFSVVTIEALNYGKPVIVPSNTGAQELIEDNISGLIFENSSPKSLSICINDVLDGKVFNSRSCFERASKFGIKNQVETLLKVYQKQA